VGWGNDNGGSGTFCTTAASAEGGFTATTTAGFGAIAGSSTTRAVSKILVLGIVRKP
jgi:hypothetical protein